MAKKATKKAAPKKSAKPAKAAPKKSGAAKAVSKKPAKPAAGARTVSKKSTPKKPAAKPSKPVKKAAPAKPAKPVAKQAAPRKEVPFKKPAAAPVSKVVAKKEVVSSKPMSTVKAQQEDNRSRYSDAELREFKDLIMKKLDEATRDYELLKNTLSHKDDHGTDDTSPTFKLLEDGSDVLSKEETAHLAARQEKYIQNLKNALIRIQNKTYGICRVTGKLIPKERLRSVPHATLSIDAKLGQNR